MASAIGVSESSLKRWADEGKIHVSRTAGGHRRISLNEAIRFIRDTGTNVVRPDVLGLAEVAAVPEAERHGPTDDRALMLYEAMSSGDAVRSRGLVMSWYLNGEPVAAICDGPVAGALRRLGELWQHSDEGIFIEHRATDICVQALQHLRALFTGPRDDAPVAIGGGRSNDPYIIPSLMVAAVLADQGYRTINLGPDTPIKVLTSAARGVHANLLWLSVMSPVKPADLEADVRQLSAAAAEQNAFVALGGRRVDPKLGPLARNLHISPSMTDLAAYAEGLRAVTFDKK
jgi:methanogenic corrinoid protein MtbC1